MVSHKFEKKIGDKNLIFEINDLASKSASSAFARLGDTLVFVAVNFTKEEVINPDFFPLSVEYEEKFYAAGKIRGSRYIKRETRPSDEAICNARLVDRAIRPLFPENLQRGVQVMATVLSWDGENDPDVLALLGASLSLLLSPLPWQGPIGAARVGKIKNQFKINPSYKEREESEFDLVVCGVKEGEEIIINMLEGDFNQTKEETVISAIQFAKPYIKEIIEFQEEIRRKIGKEKIEILEKKLPPLLEKEITDWLGKKLELAIFEKGKNNSLEEVKKEFLDFLLKKGKDGSEINLSLKIFKKELVNVLHKLILEKNKRPDSRRIDEIREIYCQAGILPRTHGSGLFCRGETKALSILTLGAPGDVQLLEGMEIVGKKRFMHHYNFPPYSTGEVKQIKGPGRREIGHGMLVERALLPVIPSFDDFPYTIRVVTEILSSNGSTSMASCCSSSLALMDAGVPIKKPVAGIALGLIKKGRDWKVLTDIQGPEDQLGDMDFKIAGTDEGITAIQLDVKIRGINDEIIKECLSRAKKARLEILEIMNKVLPKPRENLSPFAPRILTLKINPEKIREVIGPGGKTINEIIEECGVSIDIEPDGKIFITSEKEEAAKKALSWIKNITRDVKIGEVFQGKIKRIFNFGAVVELLPNQEGLLHISKLKRFGIKNPKETFKVGDIVPVKVSALTKDGKINLSLAGNFKKL
jgi:polyribonucleotide nucleotidyltransferase